MKGRFRRVWRVRRWNGDRRKGRVRIAASIESAVVYDDTSQVRVITRARPPEYGKIHKRLDSISQ